MNKDKREKRDYTRFILLWVSLLVLTFLVSDSPESWRFVIFSILGVIHLYVAATFTPLLRSWKAISAWERVTNAVEAFVEEREAVAEAKDIVDTISNTYYPSRGEIQSKKGYSTRYDEICTRLHRCTDKHNDEAKRLEGLLNNLTSIRSKHIEGQMGNHPTSNS